MGYSSKQNKPAMPWGLHSTLHDQKGSTEGQSTQVTQGGEGLPFSLLTLSAPMLLPPLLLLTSQEGTSHSSEGVVPSAPAPR